MTTWVHGRKTSGIGALGSGVQGRLVMVVVTDDAVIRLRTVACCFRASRWAATRCWAPASSRPRTSTSRPAPPGSVSGPYATSSLHDIVAKPLATLICPLPVVSPLPSGL